MLNAEYLMINKGENIQERGYRFALDIVRLVRKFPKNSEGFAVSSQLIRSVTSIPANLFEGSAGVSRKDFIQFVSVAKKSAVETKFWIRFSFDLGFVLETEFEKLIDENEQIIKILSRIILNAKQ
ncbi:MAG: four helix bundle protein [Candidatus Sungbacteria bacterium]|nr:four helix bundle protein [Candidatus Sungbacteria bacterium]